MWGAKSCEKLAPSSIGRPLRCVNQLIRGGMISVIFEGSFSIEKSFFTEWKQGNTPNEKQKNPAFGRVSFVWSLTLEHKDDYVSFGESVGIDVSVEGDVEAIVCGHRFFLVHIEIGMYRMPLTVLVQIGVDRCGQTARWHPSMFTCSNLCSEAAIYEQSLLR